MKAIALLSGGLDSTLAVRIILDQGIDVEALKFTSPFCQCDNNGRCYSNEVAREFNIPIKTMAKGEEYLEIIKNPKHGYGSGINPCIDCRIFILTKAREYAEITGADFVFTGEVLGQRPMSQHRKALEIIEREAGLEGKLLRPLCAKYLPETEAEKSGWVDRAMLLNIQGRGRREQFKLAKKYNINNFSCPAGGCLLTDKNFAGKIRDFLSYNEDITYSDIALLKIGRHFRWNKNKIILGRNEQENDALKRIKNSNDLFFEAAGCMSPSAILQGEANPDSVRLCAEMTSAYSKTDKDKVDVNYYQHDKVTSIRVTKMDKNGFAGYKI